MGKAFLHWRHLCLREHFESSASSCWPRVSAAAQTVDDGRMIQKGTLSTGVLYTHDSWSQYWEGTLKRTNGNIGTLTQQSITWVGGYGVTDRLSVMATVPYVRTHASQGVLHDLSGVQDLTFAAKLKLLTTGATRHGAFNALSLARAQFRSATTRRTFSRSPSGRVAVEPQVVSPLATSLHRRGFSTPPPLSRGAAT